MKIVVIAGDTSRAPIAAELFSATIRVLNSMMKRSITVLAVIMLRYVVFEAVISIVECKMWRIGKGVKLINPMSKTYPFTEKAIIV